MQAYVSAERDYMWALHPANTDPGRDVSAADRALAQAGDVLEGELRRMMQEMISDATVARYEAMVPPPRYGMEDYGSREL